MNRRYQHNIITEILNIKLLVGLAVLLLVHCFDVGPSTASSLDWNTEGVMKNSQSGTGWDTPAGGLPLKEISLTEIMLLKKSAESGDTDAQFLMGYFYLDGNGVMRDVKKGIEMWRRAAEKGHVVAQSNLGTLYFHGIGVMKDYSESLKWVREAAENGFPHAQHNLGEMYKFGDGVPQDYSEAFKWYYKAALNGFAESQYQVGLFFGSGKGVERNENLAVHWFGRAGAQGHQDSLEVLAEKQVMAWKRGPNRGFSLSTR